MSTSISRLKLWSHENALLLTLSVAEGLLLVDRLAVGILSPWISAELSLQSTDLGLLSAAFTVTFAASGYLLSALSDRIGNRHAFLLALVVLFSASSSLASVATSFSSLLLLRMLLGIAEGPFLPIALARMASASTPSRTSFNLAFLQQIGAFVLAQGLGPIFLTGLCQHLGWRMTFLVTGLPGLLVALLIWRLQTSGGRSESSQLHPASEEQTPRKDEARGSFLDLLRCRNILVCGGIAGCMGTWILLQMTFLPQYLVKQLGLSSSSMGFIMSMTGISGCVASLVLPLLSNRFGRRPVLIVCTGLGLLMPLSVLMLPAVPAVLMLAVLLGSISFGCSPLYVSIVPREAVPDGLTARAIALVSACSAIVGGTIMPPLAGRLADHFTLPALPLMIAAGAAATACAIACLLRESVPMVLRPALVG